MSKSYVEHSGLTVDVAVCTNCDRKDSFSEPRELKCVLGSISEKKWVCIIEDIEEPDEALVLCPNCSSDSDGLEYILD